MICPGCGHEHARHFLTWDTTERGCNARPVPSERCGCDGCTCPPCAEWRESVDVMHALR